MLCNIKAIYVDITNTLYCKYINNCLRIILHLFDLSNEKNI